MCGHKQFGIWEVSNITVVDSNVVNHWLMTGAINIPTILIFQAPTPVATLQKRERSRGGIQWVVPSPKLLQREEQGAFIDLIQGLRGSGDGVCRVFARVS